jgi:putative transcriptional regulator
VPDPDIKRIREKLGVSRSEVAMRFGLELDTPQNWKQGRNQPDRAARLLLKAIELHPSAVTAALTAT